MTKIEIDDDTIQLILSDQTNESFWYFQLGKIEANPIANDEHQFMNSFFNNGQRVWDENKGKIQSLLCDMTTNEPNEFIKQLTEGNIKDLITGIITLLHTTLSITLTLAVPLVALILKKGIHTLCKA